MNNIRTAKSSLQAELLHVQSGLAYYQSRVEALTAALHQLDEIEEGLDERIVQDVPAAQGKSKAPRKGKSAKTAKAAAQPARSAKTTSRLPATGGEFFPSLFTEQQKSLSELLDAAAQQLPFKANADDMKQLRARLVSAINTMLKSGKIRDEGKGRQRTFTRAA